MDLVVYYTNPVPVPNKTLQEWTICVHKNIFLNFDALVYVLFMTACDFYYDLS